jgi:hypothetical protein
MNLKRRSFLFGSATLISSPALGNDGFFHWRKPGLEPYDQQNRRVAEALSHFRDLLAPDPSVEAELLQKVQSGTYTSALVFPGWRATRMMFGGNRKAPNVIVDDSDFAAWGNAPKRLRMYTAQRNSGTIARFYALFYPEVCGNWSIRLGQRECVYDQVSCDQGCQELQRRQYKS